MKTSRSVLLLGSLSGPMALPQSGSVLMSMASVTMENHVDDQGLIKHLNL